MILFCGDPHAHFDHIIERVQATRPEAIILLGDQCCLSPLDEIFQTVSDRPIYFIQGNHDTDLVTYYDYLAAAEAYNIHCQIVDIGGVKVAGLGGIFRGQIWYPPEAPRYQSRADFIARCGKGNRWRGGLPLKHRSSIFPEDFELFKGQKADILVCHEAPAAHPHGFTAIDELADSLGVKQIIHGHHHNPFIYSEPRYVNVGFRGFYEIDSP